MGGWDHGGGFSLDASVRIEGADRASRERLLRYCARPPFALAHLQQHDAEHLAYICPKPRPGGPSTLVLTPLELIGKIAALVPPPRTHRHRYYGVLAPNAPLRAAVTALAPVPVPVSLRALARQNARTVRHPRTTGVEPEKRLSWKRGVPSFQISVVIAHDAYKWGETECCICAWRPASNTNPLRMTASGTPTRMTAMRIACERFAHDN